MLVRHPAVAGTFYPQENASIKAMLDQAYETEKSKFKKKLQPSRIIGGIVPHAGYHYSANEAVHFFHFLKQSNEVYDTYVILNPCHYPSQFDLALDANDAWKTPLGKVYLDKDLMEFMNIPRREDAQRNEHSAEVIVPYLQHFLNNRFRIVPVSIRKQSYKNAWNLAEKIFKANQVMKRKLAIIASSDFSHQVRPEVGFYNDNLVINRIINNSIRGLYDTIQENNISVCGFGPIMTLMFYARMIDQKYQVDILARGNSAKRAPQQELVVDYVSAIFHCS